MRNIQGEKGKFKIGTLDSLMELNENLAKLDSLVDGVVKKLERMNKDFGNDDPKILLQQSEPSVQQYINEFKWEDRTYSRNRALQEIATQMGSKVKNAESDIKRLSDELNEEKQKLAQYGKKDGTSFYTQDLGEHVYTKADSPSAASQYFERCKDSKVLSTVICIVHSTKLPVFAQNYEFWPEGSVVPDSMKNLEKQDQEGNLLVGVTVLTSAVDEFIAKSRNQGFTARKFEFDFEKFTSDQKKRGIIESRIQYLQTQLSQRVTFTFSELFICLMHVKIMRAFVDGVLRFGIPPKFFLGVIQPMKGKDKQVLENMISTFADPSMSEMYGSKDEVGDGEDFYPFVLIPMTSPIFLQ
jgi:V-type H+-transporting ATPase subunit C